MSELITKNDNRAAIRWKLMASVSAVALIAAGFAADEAFAADSDGSRPLVWIELGAQMERASGGDAPYPGDIYNHLDPSFASPVKIARELPWAFGPEAEITFQPQDSGWIFSAGIRYGRASNRRDTNQNTKPGAYYNVAKYQYGSTNFQLKCCTTYPVHPQHSNYAEIQSRHQESHLIVDFQAGKDVGLGLFGRNSSSVVSAGVRFAQFKTKSEAAVRGANFSHYNGFNQYILAYYPQKYELGTRAHAYFLEAGSVRDTKLIGPSISWNASAAIAGNSESSELSFDWGVNAALLFGKQKAKTHHQSTGRYASRMHYNATNGSGYTPIYQHTPLPKSRSRRVTVPNIGSMAGFSIKWPNAKISIGYRADYFFGAMDGGWDTRKAQTRSFMGPFASISFGLGD